MDGLETMEGRVREIVEEGVTVVKARRNKGVSKGNSRVGVKEGAYLSESAKLEEGRLANSRNMADKGMVRIKHHTEVAGRSGRGDGVVVKGNGRVSDIGTLLRSTNDEKFSFGRIESEFVGSEPMMERVKGVGKNS